MARAATALACALLLAGCGTKSPTAAPPRAPQPSPTAGPDRAATAALASYTKGDDSTFSWGDKLFHFVAEDGSVAVHVLLTVSGCPLKDTINRDVTAAVTKVPGVASIDLSLGVMTAEQRAGLKEILNDGRAQREIPFAQPGSLTKVYAIASGKGGVGKSSVTVNLALSLAAQGLKHKVVGARLHPAKQTDVDAFLKYQVEAWLSDVARPIEVEAVAFPNTSLTALRFRPPGADWVRAPNMGFGLTYALPILLAGLFALRWFLGMAESKSISN